MRTMILIGCVVLTSALTAVAQPGAYRELPTTDKGAIAAAEYAVKAQRVNEIRLKDKGKLDLAAIVKAESQVVAGTNYKLKLLIDVDGGKRDAVAVVWSKLDNTMELTSWYWLGLVRKDKK